jgi:hypothetical protein
VQASQRQAGDRHEQRHGQPTRNALVLIHGTRTLHRRRHTSLAGLPYSRQRAHGKSAAKVPARRQATVRKRDRLHRLGGKRPGAAGPADRARRLRPAPMPTVATGTGSARHSLVG